VAAHGGSHNAFTSFDYTGYFQRVAADRLDLMMQMEADRMTGLQLSPDDITVERNVVIEERNQRTESAPGALFNEHLQAALFLNHPYGVPIIGWMHELETLNYDDAMAFYKQHYAPNNAILVVAGDVTPQEVKALAEQYYGVVPANREVAPRARRQEPPHRAARRVMFRDERVAQPFFARAYLAPERNSGDQRIAAALVYLAELLGGSGATSVLGQALQYDTRQAIYTSAQYSPTALDHSSFSLVAVPAPEVPLQQIEDAVDATIANFLTHGIDIERFERIKSQFRASEIYAMDNVSGIARRYGAALTRGLTVADVHAWPQIVQSVTPQEVMEIAEQLFDEKASVTGWMMGPREETE
jgi:zinc protease